jgi:hypothetical protein
MPKTLGRRPCKCRGGEEGSEEGDKEGESNMQQKYVHHVLGYKVQQRKLKLSNITTNSKNVTIDSLQLAEAPIGHVHRHVRTDHILVCT